MDFLPSALAVLDVLKTTSENTNNIRKMLFQVLMSHPPATLIKLVNNHSPELIETFRLSLTLKPRSESIDMKMEVIILYLHIIIFFLKTSIFKLDKQVF